MYLRKRYSAAKNSSGSGDNGWELLGATTVQEIYGRMTDTIYEFAPPQLSLGG